MLLVAVGFVAGFSDARCTRVESELLLGERSTLVERQSQYVTTLVVSSLFQPRRPVVLPSLLVRSCAETIKPLSEERSIFDRPEAAKRGEGDCKSHGLVRT